MNANHRRKKLCLISTSCASRVLMSMPLKWVILNQKSDEISVMKPYINILKDAARFVLLCNILMKIIQHAHMAGILKKLPKFLNRTRRSDSSKWRHLYSIMTVHNSKISFKNREKRCF